MILNEGTVTAGDPLRVPLVTDIEIPQSPPGDDLTDLGQSEVFDESVSEVKKVTSKPSVTHKEARSSDMQQKIAPERKISSDRKKSDKAFAKANQKRSGDDILKLDRKVRDRIESIDSAANSLPRTPKHNHKDKQFSFPEMNSEEPLSRHKDHTKKAGQPKSTNVPESASKEFVYKDYTRHERKPSTPLMKLKHKKASRTGSGDSRRKHSPSSQNYDSKDSHELIMSPSQERRHDKARSSIDIGSKYVDSPSRKRRSLRQKRYDLPPTVVIDVHGPDAESDRRKRDSLQNQNIEEKDDEMHTIPLIKVSIEKQISHSPFL